VDVGQAEVAALELEDEFGVVELPG